MFSAGVTVRCPCRWRNIEDISKWSRALMLVCWFASVPSSPKRKGLHAKMRHNFPANVTRWMQKTKMLKSKYIKKNTSYSWQSVVVRVRVVLKRTVVGDWRFDNLSKLIFESENDFRWGCLKVNHQKKLFLEIPSPRRSHSMNFTYSWFKPFTALVMLSEIVRRPLSVSFTFIMKLDLFFLFYWNSK